MYCMTPYIPDTAAAVQLNAKII